MNGGSSVVGRTVETRDGDLRFMDRLVIEARLQRSPRIESTHRIRVSRFEMSMPHNGIVRLGCRGLKFEGLLQ